MLKFLTRFSALMAVLIVSALPLDAFAIRPRYKAVSYNTSRPAFERLVRGLTPTMDIRPGKSTTTDLESIRVSQIDSTIGSVSFTQSTDANKPLLTEGGRRENRQGYSESFSGAGWVKDGLTLSTNTLTATAGGTTHRLYSASTNRAYSTGAGEKIRITYILKYVNHPYVGIFDGGGANWDGASINLQTCSLDTGTASYTGSSFQVDADGRCIASIEYTQADTATTVVPQPCFLASAGLSSCANYSAAGTEQFEIYGVSIQGQEMSPTYIPTNSLPRHGSLTGQRGLYFDGSNDTMDSSAFNLSQPYTAYAIGFPYNTGYFIDGSDGTHRSLILPVSDDVSIHSGATLSSTTAWTSTPRVISALFNNTSSSIRISDGSLTSGSAGNHTITGLTLGSSYVPNSWMQGYVDRYVLYSGGHGTSTRQRLMKGFKRFYRIN